MLFVMLILSVMAFGQRTISGSITSSTQSKPMEGVSIQVKGSANGVASSANGSYQINITADSKVLVFSYSGYETKEVAIGNQTVIDVKLNIKSNELDNVVVIGYGTTTKKKLAGSITTLDAKKIEQTPFTNVGQALQGQVPGLIIKNGGGAPGSTPTVSIRGAGTPLYVVDNVITGAQDFNALNPADIETISFLKDASATAVYGSRAGNGIVLVTTKRGIKGKINVNYSYNTQLSKPTYLPAQMSAYQFAVEQNDANNYDGTPPTYTAAQLEEIKNHTNWDVFPDNNWQDLTLKKFALQQVHNLSLSGGDQKTNYFLSVGTVDQGSILKSDAVNYNRLNLRSNVTSKFDEIGLEVGVNVNASLENYSEPSSGMFAIWRAINQNTIPLYRAYNLDGTLAGGQDGPNPLAITSKEAGYNKTRDKFVNAQLQAKWQVPNIKGLKLGVMANYRDGDGYGKLWAANVPLYLQNGSLAIQLAPALSVSSYYNKRLYLESSASYANKFGKHGIDATVVYNQITSYAANLSASRRSYLSSAVDQIFAGPTDTRDNNGVEAESASAGYVVRARYDYDNKYILEFSGRYDGNDNFAPNKRWGFFPAVSAAWNVSDENFMRPLKNKDIINNLKLRGSYGQTGITDGVNRFGYIPVYNLVSASYNVGNTLANGFSEGPLVNANALSWYTRNSMNVGIDFSSLGNKLTGTVEYFYLRTTGYLSSPTNIYTQPLGQALPQVRSNSAQRRAGIEMALHYKNNIGKVNFEVGGNYAYFNQLWEQLDTEDPATLMNPYLRQTHRTDYWNGGAVYATNGLYQNGAEILNTPRLLSSTDTKAGDIRYTDTNGDGKIDAQDKRIIGLPSFPHGNYGIDFSVSYKGWFMNGFFQGTGNRYLGFDNFMTADAKRRTYVYQLDYWSPSNPGAMFPRVSSSDGVNGGNNSIATYPSDFYLQNAKYFRLKNLQIGYDLKNKLVAKTPWVRSCRMFVNGTNLFTISKVTKFFDPEQIENGNTGNVSYGYPVQSIYSFGVNVGF